MPLFARRLVLADVLDRFGFFVGRARYKHCTCICNATGHSLQEIMIFRRVPVADAVGPAMEMTGRVVRMNYLPVHIRRVEVKHALTVPVLICR